MYAGGWITHSHLHRPMIRPVVYARPVVYRPPPIVYDPPTPPAAEPPVESVIDLVVDAGKNAITLAVRRSFNFKWPLLAVMILVTVASVVYNIKQGQDMDYYKRTVSLVKNQSALAVAASKSVDPAELRCMSENIYFEAGGESLIGKTAVGLVVLNRVKSPGYPKTVCGVVHQKNGDTCMFSWLCEGAKEVKDTVNWRQSQAVAYKLLSQTVEDLTEGSTNFHGMGVSPQWKLRPTVRIDGHQFYR